MLLILYAPTPGDNSLHLGEQQLSSGGDQPSCVVICGSGTLPRLVVERLEEQGNWVELLTLPSVALSWLEGRTTTEVDLANFVDILEARWEQGARFVVLAGAVRRPSYKAADEARVLGSSNVVLAAGDNSILTQILARIERIGFVVWGAHDVIPELIPESGQLTDRQPTEDDRKDVASAARIVRKLGQVDVGQAAVVAQGLCMAVETVSGTDDMLTRCADILPRFRPELDGARGVMYKAPKSGQDRRVDLPTIGPETIRLAALAGLAGVAIEAGGVLLLDRESVLSTTRQAGMFLWSRPADP